MKRFLVLLGLALLLAPCATTPRAAAQGAPIPVARAVTPAEAEEEIVRCYPLTHADASSVIAIVRRVLGERASVAVDERTDALIVTATARAQEAAEGVIAALDQAALPVPIEAAAYLIAGEDATAFDGRHVVLFPERQGVTIQLVPEASVATAASPAPTATREEGIAAARERAMAARAELDAVRDRHAKGAAPRSEVEEAEARSRLLEIDLWLAEAQGQPDVLERTLQYDQARAEVELRQAQAALARLLELLPSGAVQVREAERAVRRCEAAAAAARAAARPRELAGPEHALLDPGGRPRQLRLSFDPEAQPGRVWFTAMLTRVDGSGTPSVAMELVRNVAETTGAEPEVVRTTCTASAPLIPGLTTIVTWRIADDAGPGERVPGLADVPLQGELFDRPTATLPCLQLRMRLAEPAQSAPATTVAPAEPREWLTVTAEDQPTALGPYPVWPSWPQTPRETVAWRLVELDVSSPEWKTVSGSTDPGAELLRMLEEGKVTAGVTGRRAVESWWGAVPAAPSEGDGSAVWRWFGGEDATVGGSYHYLSLETIGEELAPVEEGAGPVLPSAPTATDAGSPALMLSPLSAIENNDIDVQVTRVTRDSNGAVEVGLAVSCTLRRSSLRADSPEAPPVPGGMSTGLTSHPVLSAGGHCCLRGLCYLRLVPGGEPDTVEIVVREAFLVLSVETASPLDEQARTTW